MKEYHLLFAWAGQFFPQRFFFVSFFFPPLEFPVLDEWSRFFFSLVCSGHEMVRGWEKGAKLHKRVSVAKKATNYFLNSACGSHSCIMLKTEISLLFLLQGFCSALIWRKKTGGEMGTERTKKGQLFQKCCDLSAGKRSRIWGGNRVSEATHAITRLFFSSLPLLFLSREQGGGDRGSLCNAAVLLFEIAFNFFALTV